MEYGNDSIRHTLFWPGTSHFTLNAPLEPGSYEIRLFDFTVTPWANNDSFVMAIPFTVG
jgi:hypothetical protein